MSNRRLFLFTSVLLVLGASAGAFNGHIVTEGPLRLEIGAIPVVQRYDSPQKVAVTLKNNHTAPLQVNVHLADLVDEWYSVGAAEMNVRVNPHADKKIEFQIAAGEGAFSALYPVHFYATFKNRNQTLTAHAVQIFESRFETPLRKGTTPDELPLVGVPPHGSIRLDRLNVSQVSWRYFDQALKYMSLGWRGADSESGTNFSIYPVTRGTTKNAIVMHPPWRGGRGSVFVAYRLKLPVSPPVRLLFANAIRNHQPPEPPSDGVTFRVWANGNKLFDRHTDSKKWLPGEVDLSQYAGREILLRLESHPGPKRDTTCDSSYWAEPAVLAGRPIEPLTARQRDALRIRARRLVAGSNTTSQDEFLFRLEDGYTAALVLGKWGLLDGVIALGKADSCVVFDGLQVSILGRRLTDAPPQMPIQKIHTTRDNASSSIQVHHELLSDEKKVDFIVTLRSDRSGLRMECRCADRITDLSLGPADQKAPRVYYGHGYCIENPDPFRAGFGGHNLSTSHVGFDFEQGMSVLTACDNPPDFLEVNPPERMYALHTHMNTVLTLVPASNGVFDCAMKFRVIDPRQPSPGFAKKAGRYVFDIWGGRYADNAALMKRMIAYGLTDSLLTLHVWQRWGYDYRLPDIYPPLPDLGSVADLRKVGEVCEKHDIPWGLHDNYIDFYPDAKDYSYDHICFTEDGRPIKAWINRGRDAQSYRWRPDRIMPFVQRNLKLIKTHLRPTHYFIDVFTSINMFDFYDRTGKFHSMLETRQCWGESFRWIQDYLNGAITTSEAGDDQLVGYLDGADCQFMQLSTEGKSFHNRVKCRDWERVPWFDAVWHDKFSLHGVGYSGRYQGGRSRRQHGIESDDYISAEILTGHALMIDRAAFTDDSHGRGAIRKYWLAQDFIRSIATDTIREVKFHQGDIHRQIVSWNKGAGVYVNRGANDWKIAGKVLPPYGFVAQNGPIESSIERLDDIIVEQAKGPSRYYVNARGFNPEGGLAVRPWIEKMEDLGNRRLKLIVNWDVLQTPKTDLSVFLHFKSEKSPRYDKIAFQGDFRPQPGTTSWRGRIPTGGDRIITIPEQFGAGDYEIIIGLWDPATGRRISLDGEESGNRGYRLGKLVVQGEGKNVTGIRLVTNEYQSPPRRWNVARKPVNFGRLHTSGACRLEIESNAIWVTPLPEMEPFTIRLMMDQLMGKKGNVKSIEAYDIEKNMIREMKFEQENSSLSFQTRREDFAYKISWR